MFPIPPLNNGLGIHFGPATQRLVERFMPIMKELHMTWVVLTEESDDLLAKAVPKFLENGIEPVVRVDRKINRGQSWYGLTKKCGASYMQIYNEPGDDREWAGNRPHGWRERFRDKWIGAAHSVRAAAGFPGLQVMSPGELADMLRYMKATGNDSLWPDMWLSLHLYPALGCPPSCDKHGEYDILGYRLYAKVCQEIMGFIPPMIVTEGGYTDGQGTPEERAGYMVEIYEWFKHGTAPEYLLAFCPWILFSRPIAQWWGFSWADNEKHQKMMQAVKNMNNFVRTPGEEPQPPTEDNDTEYKWRVVSKWITEQEFAEELFDINQYSKRPEIYCGEERNRDDSPRFYLEERG